jgi:hypothetical protein
MKIATIPLLLVSLACTSLSAIPEASAQKTRKCSPAAKAAIAEAVQWMKNHQNELKNDFKLAKRKGVRRRIRRRFDRKLSKIRFSCAERVLCKDKAPRVALHAFGIAGNKIRLCYDKMQKRNYNFCTFTGVVAHEFGHTIGIPKDRVGGHSRNQNDRVYQFGWFARDLCQRTVSDNYLLRP